MLRPAGERPAAEAKMGHRGALQGGAGLLGTATRSADDAEGRSSCRRSKRKRDAEGGTEARVSVVRRAGLKGNEIRIFHIETLN